MFCGPVQPVSLVIKHDDVKVDFSTVFVAQNKIPCSGFLQLYVFISSLFEQLTQLQNIFLLNGYIQVLMEPGLFTKERVNAPPAIYSNCDP